MTRLGLSDVHFKIVTAVAGGATWTQAAKQFGNYSESYSRVLRSRLMAKPKVRQMLDEFRNELRDKAMYDAEACVKEIDKAIEFAYQRGNPMSIAKLLTLKAELYGLLVQRIEVVPLDLAGALEEAKNRIINITPHLSLPPDGSDGRD